MALPGRTDAMAGGEAEVRTLDRCGCHASPIDSIGPPLSFGERHRQWPPGIRRKPRDVVGETKSGRGWRR
eukprot:357121-Chlamydomonas_euryale.AAC.5